MNEDETKFLNNYRTSGNCGNCGSSYCYEGEKKLHCARTKDMADPSSELVCLTELDPLKVCDDWRPKG